MRIPTSRAEKTIRQIVRMSATSYTISRPGTQKGRFGEGTPTLSTHSADLWLFDPDEANIDTDFGDRLTGSLGGMSLPGENLAVGDRLTFQGTEYEVAEIIHRPEEHPNTVNVVKEFSLERRVNA